MAGAWSFIQGLFGLGAGGAIGAGKALGQYKKVEEYKIANGYYADEETKKMRERVQEEWYHTHKACPNAAGRFMSSYPDYMGPSYQMKYWFEDHLRAKGIPYDEFILEKVTGVSYEKMVKRQLANTVNKYCR